MKMEINAKILFYAGFSIIFFKQLLRYFIGPVYMIALALGIILCLASLAINFQRLTIPKKDRPLVGFLVIIFFLHSLLAFIDTDGSSTRSLWLSGLIQFITIALFIHNKNSINTWIFLKNIFIISILIECTLAFFQISYYSTGIGLAPNSDEYGKYSVVTGSFLNPNDFSVYITVSFIALHSLWLFEQKENRGILLAGLVLIAVFASLSRTAFMFLSLFLFFTILRSSFNTLISTDKKSALVKLIIFILTPLSITYIFQNDFITSTDVFVRSITKVIQIGDITNDESTSVRAMVYTRLLENVPNLGFGTLSDQNYSKFFHSNDFALMKVNPHSFLAEMSFLYGWLGLVTALGLLTFIALGILKNQDLSISTRLIASGSLFFLQSVPSSILDNTNYFLPYLLIMYCKTRYQKPIKRAANNSHSYSQG